MTLNLAKTFILKNQEVVGAISGGFIGSVIYRSNDYKDSMLTYRGKLLTQKMSVTNFISNVAITGVCAVIQFIEQIESAYFYLKDRLSQSMVGRKINPILENLDNRYIAFKMKIKNMMMDKVKEVIKDNMSKLGPIVADAMLGGMSKPGKAKPSERNDVSDLFGNMGKDTGNDMNENMGGDMGDLNNMMKMMNNMMGQMNDLDRDGDGDKDNHHLD